MATAKLENLKSLASPDRTDSRVYYEISAGLLRGLLSMVCIGENFLC